MSSLHGDHGERGTWRGSVLPRRLTHVPCGSLESHTSAVLRFFLTSLGSALLVWGHHTRATDAGVTPNSKSNGPRFAIMAEYWSRFKGVLEKGDGVYAFCPRSPRRSSVRRAGRPPAPAVWDENRFRKRIQSLNAVRQPGIEKAVVFSSINDLRSAADRIPRDVAWVLYDTERSMTPVEEMANIEGSVRDFARFAHGRGWKVGWGPTLTLLQRTDDRLLKLARYVDRIGLQHQKVLVFRGINEFVRETERRARLIREENPRCLVSVQVVLRARGPEECVKALCAVRRSVDAVSVWSLRNPQGIREVVERVRAAGKAGVVHIR